MPNKQISGSIKNLPALLKKEQALAPSARNGRAQFIAALPEINAALEAGYSLRDIWNLLFKKGVFTSGYHAFARHVRLRCETNKEKKIQPKLEDSVSLISEDSKKIPSFFSEPNPTPEKQKEISPPSPAPQTSAKMPKMEPFVPPSKTEKKESEGMQIIKPVEKPSVRFNSIPNRDELI